MFDILWGLKTEALFDVWSIEHVVAGASIGALVAYNNEVISSSHENHQIYSFP